MQAKLGERAEQALRRRVPIRLGDAVDKNLEVRLTPLDDITVRRSESAMHTMGDQPLNEKIADVQSMTSSFRRRFLTTRPRTRMRPFGLRSVSARKHTRHGTALLAYCSARGFLRRQCSVSRRTCDAVLTARLGCCCSTKASEASERSRLSDPPRCA